MLWFDPQTHVVDHLTDTSSTRDHSRATELADVKGETRSMDEADSLEQDARLVFSSQDGQIESCSRLRG